MSQILDHSQFSRKTVSDVQLKRSWLTLFGGKVVFLLDINVGLF